MRDVPATTPVDRSGLYSIGSSRHVLDCVLCCCRPALSGLVPGTLPKWVHLCQRLLSTFLLGMQDSSMRACQEAGLSCNRSSWQPWCHRQPQRHGSRPLTHPLQQQQLEQQQLGQARLQQQACVTTTHLRPGTGGAAVSSSRAGPGCLAHSCRLGWPSSLSRAQHRRAHHKH